MNIEHAYFERTDEYKAFPGICLVDTFELAESKQVPMFRVQNTQRVERQKQQQIFVIIGNPPLDVGEEFPLETRSVYTKLFLLIAVMLLPVILASVRVNRTHLCRASRQPARPIAENTDW